MIAVTATPETRRSINGLQLKEGMVMDIWSSTLMMGLITEGIKGLAENTASPDDREKFVVHLQDVD